MHTLPAVYGERSAPVDHARHLCLLLVFCVAGKEPESQIGKPIMFTNFGRNKKLGKGNSNNAESQQ